MLNMLGHKDGQGRQRNGAGERKVKQCWRKTTVILDPQGTQ